MTGKIISDLMAEPIRERPEIAGWWLTESNLVLLYSPRGSGKSTVALAVSLGAAAGTGFLKWKSSRRYRVAYIDSELGSDSVQIKVRQVDSAAESSLDESTQVKIYTRAEMGGRAWNISDLNVQKEKLTEIIEDVDLIVFDNLLGLLQPAHSRDTEIDIWRRFEDWAIPLRDKGKSMLLVHHSGKSGLQYGTVLKENTVDTVVSLKPARDPEVNGIALDMHFEKTRWGFGPQLSPMRLTYAKTDSGKQVWDHMTLEAANVLSINKRLKRGWNKKQIASYMKISEGELADLLTGSWDIAPTPTPLPDFKSPKEEEYDEFN